LNLETKSEGTSVLNSAKDLLIKTAGFFNKQPEGTPIKDRTKSMYQSSVLKIDIADGQDIKIKDASPQTIKRPKVTSRDQKL
jgi:hypothetical protein